MNELAQKEPGTRQSSGTGFEAVIGLEVHAQLRTATKIFCSCSTQFGAAPNSHTCPVCLGLPGALPVLNERVVEMAIKAAQALDCQINQASIFARKNYFYPDLPKGYQISQFDRPLAEHGHLEVWVRGRKEANNPKREYHQKRFRIKRIHLEEDAGKSIHPSAADTLVDLNRAGVPLIEIVSEPDLRSGREAHDYLDQLRRILLYLEICDGNMEEGSLRCDANVSVRPSGTSTLGTKVEIKNMNSMRFLEKALEFEIGRQTRRLRSGKSVEQETRLWDQDLLQTKAMRSKEEAHDYRYFPDPDLLPLKIPSDWIEKIRSELPELPASLVERFVSDYQLSLEDALAMTSNRAFADYFEEVVERSKDPKAALNWMMGELTRQLNQDKQSIAESRLTPSGLSSLINMIQSGRISGKIAKEVFLECYKSGETPEAVVEKKGLSQISDSSQLEAAVDQVLSSHPDQVEAFQKGKEGLLGFFVGQVMRETKGQANPQLVNTILKERLGGAEK